LVFGPFFAHNQTCSYEGCYHGMCHVTYREVKATISFTSIHYCINTWT